MGEILSIVEDLDGSIKAEAEAIEHLKTLDSMANLKVDYFNAKLEDDLIASGTGGHLRDIPINHILKSDNAIHAYISANEDQIKGSVTTFLNKLIFQGRENVMSGLSLKITEVVTAFLRSNSSVENEIQKMYLVADKHGGLFRLDLLMWSRSVISECLKTKVEKVFVAFVCVSVPDVLSISFEDFFTVYRDSLPSDLDAAELENESVDIRSAFEEMKSNIL